LSGLKLLPVGGTMIDGGLVRIILAAIVFFIAAASAYAEPIEHWQNANSVTTGWSAEVLKAVQDYGKAVKPTSVMVVQDGQIIASFGDVSRKVNMQSVRKSLLSALYGIAVSEKRISLTSTLAELGIDDKPPSLTDVEKRATVRDLLMARSGVYHPAAYENADMAEKRPPRGSHLPGSFWYYNNWDFNALGTIYRRATDEDIFQSFEHRIARPIGMEDFLARDGKYVTEPQSIHQAYPFSLSARDAARFGLLFLNGGQWRGREIISTAWIRESTATYSQTDRLGRGYGYLWWTLQSEEWGADAILASGDGGQLIAVIPSKRLVAVENVDPAQNAQGVRTPSFLDLIRKIASAAP
jgi:CubicO group peptidase (beta-lactamase class C family)